jgi:hypothetical protein
MISCTPMLSLQNIEAELSYAYLHAVAATAGMSCAVSDRHLDNAGVDAAISANDQFAPDSVYTDLTLHVQLKATTKQPTEAKGRLSYFMHDVKRYDKLRTAKAVPPRVLVVLFLPVNLDEWVTWSIDRLVLQKCALWVSLRGANPSTNRTGETVYLPQNQVFSPDGLKDLMTRLSRNEQLLYDR